VPGPANRDQLFDKWYWCTHRGRPDRLDAASGLSCDDLNGPAAPFFGTLPGFLSKTREEILAINPNDGRKFAVLSNAEQKTRITRTGFDLSNRFRLHPRLNMTLSADYQRERLSEESRITNSEDLLNLRGLLTGMTYLAGPRGGKRREWGTNLVFDWQATDRLKISAGLRYHNFRGFDTALAEGRARRDPRYQAGGGDSSTYSDGVYIPYFELVGDRERRDWDAVSEQSRRAYQSGDDAAIAAADPAGPPHGERGTAAHFATAQDHLVLIGLDTVFGPVVEVIDVATGVTDRDGLARAQVAGVIGVVSSIVIVDPAVTDEHVGGVRQGLDRPVGEVDDDIVISAPGGQRLAALPSVGARFGEHGGGVELDGQVGGG